MTSDQLRNSILQEAISGRLVPQDPNDEPASALLARIREEKARLVKEGKLKKKDLVETPITEDEIPFEIPDSWEWVRLGYLVDFSKSSSVKASSISPNAWILDLEDIHKNTGVLLRKKRMGETVSISDKHQFKKGNVLYSKLRPYLNKVIVADEDGYCTSEILCFNFGEINNRYAQLFLMSAFFVDYAMKDAYGVKMPRLGSKQGNNALFPLPPLAEQQRIVAKLEELLPIVEQYGKAQKELDELNAALPARLRQSILQEAFTGKLTHADTTEWIEENLGKIADFLYGFPFQANMFNEEKNGKPIIRIRNIVPSWTRTYSTEICDEKYLITKGDMLVGMDGNFNVRFWKGEDAYLNQRVCRITAHVGKLHQKYLYYYLPVYLQELEENVSRTTVGHLSDKHLRNMPIPLPPLAEQQRIVAKIEELFEQIDQIKK